MKKMLSKRVAAAVCASMVALGTAGCGGSTVAVSEAAAIRVHTQPPVRDSISQKADFTGRVMPDDSVSVFGKAAGTVLKTYFEVGDAVKEGQLLYELDPTDMQLGFEQAKVAYEMTLKGIDSAESGSGNELTELDYQSKITAAQNAYESARAELQRQLDEPDFNMSRYKKVYKAYKAAEDAYDKNPTTDTAGAFKKAETDYYEELEQYGSRTMYNYYYVAFETAYDSYETALKAYDIYKGITSGENNVTFDLQRQQAKLAYESAQQAMDNLKIYAPINGIIEKKNVTANGQYSPAAGAGYVVSNKDVLVVNFAVASDIAAAMGIGDEVTVEYGQQSYAAAITEIGTMIDASSGLFPVKARLLEGANMLSGVSVKLTAITAKAENSLIIPLSAIYYDNGAGYVYTEADNVAVRTPVVIGIISGDSAEILSGIDDTARIITTWNPNLADGTAVEVGEEV